MPAEAGIQSLFCLGSGLRRSDSSEMPLISSSFVMPAEAGIQRLALTILDVVPEVAPMRVARFDKTQLPGTLPIL